MNVIDFVLIISSIVLLAAHTRVSATFYGCASLGFFIGFGGGLILTPVLTSSLSSNLAKGIGALGIIFTGALLGGAIGVIVGNKLRLRLLLSRFYTPDHMLAVPTKVLTILVLCIFLAQTLIFIPILSLQFLAQGSTIFTVMNKIVPSSPLQTLTQHIAPNQFHDLQLAYDPAPLTYNNITNAGQLQSVIDSVAPSVVKVSSHGCAGLGFGSGFVAQPHLVITNVHVIAGGGTI